MLLAVLSGEKPVTEVVESAGISRGTYYQLETRAIQAMLKALGPASSTEEKAKPRARQIEELERKVKKLEQARRRAERLLQLTRKVIEGTSVKLRVRRTGSTGPGRSPLRTSRKEKASVSIPTPAGADAP